MNSLLLVATFPSIFFHTHVFFILSSFFLTSRSLSINCSHSLSLHFHPLTYYVTSLNNISFPTSTTYFHLVATHTWLPPSLLNLQFLSLKPLLPLLIQKVTSISLNIYLSYLNQAFKNLQQFYSMTLHFSSLM
jgi:hypothetical protein